MHSLTPGANTGACCAVTTPTRRPGLRAWLERIAAGVLDSLAVHRSARHELRYMQYLDDAALRDLGLSRRQMLSPELDPQGARRRGAGPGWPPSGRAPAQRQ